MSQDEWSHGIWAILILLCLLVAISTIWKNIRPEPSVAAQNKANTKEIDDKIASASTALEKRIDGKLDDLRKQLQAQESTALTFRTSLEKTLQDIQRAIGRIEGTLGSKSS